MAKLNRMKVLHLLYILIGNILQLNFSTGKLDETRSGGDLTIVKNGVEYQLTTKQCNSGVFFPTPTHIDCVCLTGIWGFYPNYCDKPAMFIGGDNYCFRMEKNLTITQAALVGSFRYPFTASISYFQEANFIQLENVISTDYHVPKYMGTTGSWITITNRTWTLYGDGGQSVCLQPCATGPRIYCLYNEEIRHFFNESKWNYITKVRQGCHSENTTVSDLCYTIKRENINDDDACDLPPIVEPCHSSDCKNGSNGGVIVYDIADDPTLYDPDCGPNIWFPKPTSNPTLATATTEEPCESTPSPEGDGDGKGGSKGRSSDLHGERQCEEITRDAVMQFWEDPSLNECPKTISQALFTSQLERVAAKGFEQIFKSKLKSLEQMSQIVILSKDIMKKTCGNDYVPAEYFDVATDAFLHILREDFFYGLDAIDDVNFRRMQKTLNKCWKRAKLLLFESIPLTCDIKKITGGVILPGREVYNITIPYNAKSKHYEPIIETTWKMFLHAHSYCYEDFQYFNDHHEFSLVFMELFSKTIYEKWMEPLSNKALYKLILPKYNFNKEIMENLDYCVGALDFISKCPVWLSRSNPKAKSVNNEQSTGQENKSETLKRRKRSSWTAQREHERERTSIWNKLGHCVQYMEEPMSSLGLAYCNQIY